MSILNQKEAVYSSIVNILRDNGVEFENGMNVKPILSKEMKSSVVDVIVNGFIEGGIAMADESKTKYVADHKELRNYTIGLVNNWVAKDVRLNGGAKHTIKNPGSRTGSGDDVIKTLKTLRLLKKDDADAVAEIDLTIAQRVAEIKPKTAKAVALTQEQIDLIPTELRAKLGL